MTADEILALRAKLDMTQAQFARAIGVSQGTVSDWEAGNKSPRALKRLAIERLKKRKARK